MATYVAITSTNPRNGYRVIAEGTSKNSVEAAARAAIGDIRTEYGTDIYRETEHTNLRVVSKTVAKRQYKVSFDNSDY